MTLHQIEPSNWLLEGSVRFNKECKLINARARLKRVLMECQAGLVLSSAETKAFSDYLSRTEVLSVQPDEEPFPSEGPTRSWTVVEPTSQPPPQQQPSAATGAGAPGAGGPAAAGAAAATPSSRPPPPPPQARHQPPWALPAAHQCVPGGRGCGRCPGAGAPPASAARRSGAEPVAAPPAAAAAAAPTPGPPPSGARTVVVVPGPQMRAAAALYDGPPAAYPGHPAPPPPPPCAAAGGRGAPAPPGANGAARGAVAAAGLGAGRGMPPPAWGFAGIIAAQPVRPAGRCSLGAGRGNLGIAAAPSPAAAWGLGDPGSAAVGAGGAAARPPATAAAPGTTSPGPGDVLREPGRLAASLPVPPAPGSRAGGNAGLGGGAAAAPTAAAPGAAEGGAPAAAGAGVGPATPSRRLGVPSRQRGTPPEDVRSPQQKRGCLGDGAARARRGDGGRSPAASKGLDFGSTPARVGAPIGGESGDSGPSPPPLSRVLDYSSSTPGPAAAPPPAPSEVRGPAGARWRPGPSDSNFADPLSG